MVGRDFITKKARLTPSCVLETGFVSLVLHPQAQSTAMSHGMARIRLGRLERMVVAFYMALLALVLGVFLKPFLCVCVSLFSGLLFCPAAPIVHPKFSSDSQ